MFLKYFLILSSSFFILSTQAANYGKFKLVPNVSIIDSEAVVFLLSSNGDIKFLENDYDYTINADFFFGELKLEFISGGDEDALHAIYNLSNNQITSGCVAYVDYKNLQTEALAIKNFQLLRWSKSNRKYESIVTRETSSDTSACYKDLLRDQGVSAHGTFWNF